MPDDAPPLPPDDAPAPAADILDVLPDPPAVDTPPNVQAAAASLIPEPAPPEPGAAPGPGPSSPAEGVKAGTIRPPLTGAIRERAAGGDRWSDRTIQRAKRKDLTKRVRELQDQLRAAGGTPNAAPGEPGSAPALAVDPVQELDELFGVVLPAVSALLEYLVGPEMKLEPTDARVLQKTGAPALLPYYAKARSAAPVAPFLVAVASVFGPKAVAAAKRQQREKRERQERGEEPAPRKDVVRLHPPEPRTSPAGDAFGGPRV